MGPVKAVAVTILLLAATAVLAEEGVLPNQGKVSFSAGSDITNAYFFRGILQEDQGIIVQPWLEASISLTDKMSMSFGIWNSFHDAKTNVGNKGGGSVPSGNEPDSWYEADLYVGVSFATAENCQLGVTYTAYTSPNDAFSTVHEFALNSSYDDSARWDGTVLEGHGLQPSVTIAFETEGSALGPDEGIYLELAISPSFALIESADYPVTLSVPVTLGLSLSDYYGGATNDPNFGYLDIGMDLSMPLTAISAEYGQWEVSAGVHYMLLSENTELTNNGDDSEFIFSFGLGMSY